jgi:hypothetical protein
LQYWAFGFVPDSLSAVPRHFILFFQGKEKNSGKGMDTHAGSAKLKVTLLGDAGSGKTSYLEALLQLEEGTPGNHLRIANVALEGGVLEVWDTAGAEKWGALRDGYYIGSQGALIFFGNRLSPILIFYFFSFFQISAIGPLPRTFSYGIEISLGSVPEFLWSLWPLTLALFPGKSLPNFSLSFSTS